jgi:signal transduction histidine kinase/ligand-binding sensor domain-containing protein
MQDGFFSGAPVTIAQTKDGYLWVGTESGLFRFDGVRFVPFTPPDGKKLPSSRIDTLFGGSDGSLWIGAGGLSRWFNHELTNYPDYLGRVITILERRNGQVWFSRFQPFQEAGGLCQVIDSRTKCYGKAEGFPISSAIGTVEDNSGGLWSGDQSSVVHWRDGSSEIYKPRGLKANQSEGVMALAAAPNGSVWVGIERAGPGLGLQQIVNGTMRPFITPEFDSSSLSVTALLIDRENSLWIGTATEGIYRLRGRTVDRYRSTDGLSSDTVRSFFEDHEGNVWVATARGIDSFHDLRVATFASREGFPTDEAFSVIASRNGTVWAGGSNSLIAFREGRVSTFRVPGNQVTSLLDDHAGRLWVGVDNSLFVFEHRKFRQITKADNNPLGFAVGITEDINHEIWAETIGPPRTLFRIKNFKVQEEFRSPQMPAARKLASAPDGSIWLGLLTGDLARYTRGKLDIFRFKRSESPTLDSLVNELLVNPDGSVIGATGFGLIGWKDGRQQTLTVQNGLPCDDIHTLVLDTAGALWMSTKCGLIEIPRTEIQRWWEAPEAVLQVRTFNALDGAQPGLVPFQGSARSTDGQLWFANGVALQMINPAVLMRNPLPPPVHIEQVIADRKFYAPLDYLRLPPISRDLQIDYTALSFVIPQKVQFRYRLEGRDVDWQEPGTRRQAFYNDLPPGTYRFQVIASNNDAVWNDIGAALTFSVAPAWYQTIWFRLVCVVAACFVAWLIYQMRISQVRSAISARFDERLAERTRMARELHDTFLQTIQGSKMVADDALERSSDTSRMRRALEQLSVWLEQAAAEGRAALNSLRTSTTTRNDLAEAIRRATEDPLLAGHMAVSLSVVGDVREMHPIVRDEIYRIGYEAIRNAQSHSGGSRLDVELTYGHDLSLRVHDNGVGIDPTLSDHEKDGHFGIRGMRERAARIGGKLNVVGSSASGTEITVVVPGANSFVNSSANPISRLQRLFRRHSKHR